jgi:prephenate dehydrogenase
MSRTRVAILGLGLIGGSLGLALRQVGSEQVEVTGFARRAITGELALQMGAVDKLADTPQVAVQDADFVFLCTPVLQMLPMAETVLPAMKPGAVLTDVGSTKGWFVKKIRSLLPQHIHYIGGHPMAGRERSGMEAAQADLFRDKWFIFTPLPDTPPDLMQRLRQLIQLTGAKTAELDERTHDQVTAVISHVPHVVAAGLVQLLRKQSDPALTARFIGGGFRDTTRIASSDADMWADICMTNSENIAAELDATVNLLGNVATMIRAGDRQGVHDYFTQAKQLRDALLTTEKELK